MIRDNLAKSVRGGDENGFRVLHRKKPQDALERIGWD